MNGEERWHKMFKELVESSSTIQKFRIVQQEGSRKVSRCESGVRSKR